ncbi:MAG: prepilin-type N-terminal cleavage/methylation domain-containing protein [Acidobacteria bacterium]|nr:prepilin-type N-terminal cleavage/methylation domain-containing protein [Acidobacteriota bacterium]
MISRLNRRRGQKGFTLIELLIVVAIIGIIAAILIPNLLDALQKAKQKRTVGDIRNLGSAWFSWYQDQNGAAAAGAASTYDWSALGTTIDAAGLLSTLYISNTMFYIQQVPANDAWGNEYGFAHGANLDDAVYMGIRSPGRGDDFEGDTYTMGPFIGTDYNRDIVWADGFFVAYPAGVKTVDAGTP